MNNVSKSNMIAPLPRLSKSYLPLLNLDVTSLTEPIAPSESQERFPTLKPGWDKDSAVYHTRYWLYCDRTTESLFRLDRSAWSRGLTLHDQGKTFEAGLSSISQAKNRYTFKNECINNLLRYFLLLRWQTTPENSSLLFWVSNLWGCLVSVHFPHCNSEVPTPHVNETDERYGSVMSLHPLDDESAMTVRHVHETETQNDHVTVDQIDDNLTHLDEHETRPLAAVNW